MELIPIGDVHIGSVACDEDGLAATVAHILAAPHRYTILMGDHIDAINPNDKRFDPSCLHPRYFTPEGFDNLCDEQADTFVQIVRPLAEAGRVLGCHYGNHEEKINRLYHRDIHRYITKGLSDVSPFPIRDLTYTALHQLRFKRPGKAQTAVRGYSYHGKSGTNLHLWSSRVSADFDAAFYLHGHNHRCEVVNKPYGLPGPDGEYAVGNRTFVFTSTYMKQYVVGPTKSQYGEVRGYPFVHLGPTVVRIDCETGQVWGYVIAPFDLEG